MPSPDLSFYKRLARWRWPRSYQGKFLFLAFVGTHVPLVGAVVYVLLATNAFAEMWPVLLVLLLATAAGAALTMAGLHGLLRPLARTGRALRRYAEDGTPPDLPTDYGDEAGRLMRDTQATLAHLDELGRFRDRLFSVVVHDLRSPATSILLAADALEDVLEGPSGPDAREADREMSRELLSMIRRSTQQQLVLSETLLGQVRRDSLRLDIRPEAVQPGALLRRAAEEQQLAAEHRNVRFAFDLGDAPGEIHTDARLVAHVLQNLIANAVSFSPPGGTITLAADDDGEHILFTVRDEGSGMSHDELKDLFEPFRTGLARRDTTPPRAADGDRRERDPDEPSREGGFGLGLWIGRTFASLLGGSLEAESPPGEAGSLFRLRLPRTLPQAEEAADAPAATVSSASDSTRR